ncbi:hypothetical protein AXG93_2396s1230 [Marchantia polymorpha subsp. ruderalis]|uniref:Uncharacterized protein n=1 Tax=Marchantia polymorpha subsp. ruderalis TaxID=1480154 RepID=A0A176VEE9_MARPO|nr:hypothetical protein AXG93_2396s1230 [Marchantia polymorpha subsp. ruderalis]
MQQSKEAKTAEEDLCSKILEIEAKCEVEFRGVEELSASLSAGNQKHEEELADWAKKLVDCESAKSSEVECKLKVESDCRRLREQLGKAEMRSQESQRRMEKAEEAYRQLREESTDELKLRLEKCLNGFAMWGLQSALDTVRSCLSKLSHQRLCVFGSSVLSSRGSLGFKQIRPGTGRIFDIRAAAAASQSTGDGLASRARSRPRPSKARSVPAFSFRPLAPSALGVLPGKFLVTVHLALMAALMEDLVAALRKEEKLLDADAWKYAAPRSRRSDIS